MQSLPGWEKCEEQKQDTVKTENSIGIAIIGCGAISYANAEAIGRSESARLTYAMDLNAAAARALGEKYSVPHTDCLERVLSAPEVDAVFICTPHFQHLPLARAAAAAGKHLIVEKPMGAGLEESRGIVAAAREAGVKLSVCYCMRYSAKVGFARWFVREGGLGELVGAEIVMLRDQSERFLGHDTWQEGSVNWHGVKTKSGGGLFIDNISHYLDYYMDIAGLGIESVFCRAASCIIPSQVEDNLFALLKFENNALGTVIAGFGVRGGGQQQDDGAVNALQRLWGKDGQLLLLPRLKAFSIRRVDGCDPNRWYSIKPSRVYNSLGTGPEERGRFIEGFARAVLEDREPEIPGEAGVRVMAVIDAAYRSARSGREERSAAL